MSVCRYKKTSKWSSDSWKNIHKSQDPTYHDERVFILSCKTVLSFALPISRCLPPHSTFRKSSQLIGFGLGCLKYLMIWVSHHADIGPVSITTDPEKFQQDLQELFVQVGTRILGPFLPLLTHFDICMNTNRLFFAHSFSSLLIKTLLDWLILDWNCQNVDISSVLFFVLSLFVGHNHPNSTCAEWPALAWNQDLDPNVRISVSTEKIQHSANNMQQPATVHNSTQWISNI